MTAADYCFRTAISKNMKDTHAEDMEAVGFSGVAGRIQGVTRHCTCLVSKRNRVRQWCPQHEQSVNMHDVFSISIFQSRRSDPHSRTAVDNIFLEDWTPGIMT